MFLTFNPSCICFLMVLEVSPINSFLSLSIAFFSIVSLSSSKLTLLRLILPFTARSPSTTSAPPTLTSDSVFRVSVARWFCTTIIPSCIKTSRFKSSCIILLLSNTTSRKVSYTLVSVKPRVILSPVSRAICVLIFSCHFGSNAKLFTVFVTKFSTA